MALRELKISWDTFNFKVWCVVGPHRCLPAYVKKRHRRVYKATKAHADELGGCYFRSTPKYWGILWLPRYPRTPKELGYLSHEMGHAVWDLCSQRGVDVDSLNDEVFCYAIAHGVTKALEGLKA